MSVRAGSEFEGSGIQKEPTYPDAKQVTEIQTIPGSRHVRGVAPYIYWSMLFGMFLFIRHGAVAQG